VLKRIARNLAAACGVLTLAAWAWAPGRPLVALGVLGGALLAGLSFWALAGVVTAIAEGRESGEMRPVSRAALLVKFFTRHGILAVGAYVMMARLHLDPVGMLVGVTSVVVAAAVEAARRH
jgi:hypothetical protein